MDNEVVEQSIAQPPLPVQTPAERQALLSRTFVDSPTQAKEVSKTNKPKVQHSAPPATQQAAPVEAAPPAQTVAPQVAAPPVEIKVATPSLNFDDLTDEQIDEILAKKTKGKVTSLKSLTEEKVELTAEQKAEKARKKTQDALEWGLGTNKIKKEDYDKSVVVKGKTNREIALDLFTAELKEDDPKIAADVIEQLFQDYYMEASDETDTTRKLRLKEMNRIADNYRKDVTNGIDGLESEYDTYQAGEARYKSYGNQVDAIFESLPKDRKIKFTYTGPDGKDSEVELSYTLDDADIKQVKRYIRGQEGYFGSGANTKEVKNEELLGAIEYNIRANTMDKVLAKVAAEAAKKGAADQEAFIRAIPKTNVPVFNMQMQNTQAKRDQLTPAERKKIEDRLPKPAWKN